jgi:paraquat-inducible protein B
MSDFLKIKQIEGLTSQLAAKALDADVVKKANNLSDVTASTARTNLAVYSKTEVDTLIAGAKNAYSVADTTARNALIGLKVSDRVFVTNDGDSKWALYIVTAITTGTGSTSTFKKIADEDLFLNALTAEAVKAAYESNADTYVFNGTYKGKLDKITVTANVNLDTIKSTADSALANAATAQTTANTANSAAAAAQSTANSASSAASAAQTTANNAATAAAAAQTTANSKEDAFTETTENFTAMTSAGNVEVPIALANPPKAGFAVNVFFNGMRVRRVTFTAGNRNISYNVPFETEANDDITVVYSY